MSAMEGFGLDFSNLLPSHSMSPALASHDAAVFASSDDALTPAPFSVMVVTMSVSSALTVMAVVSI